MASLELHDATEPPWIRVLIEDVLVPSLQPLGFLGQIGYRFWTPEAPDNDCPGWDVAAFPAPYEIRGSHRNDGANAVNGFALDVGRIISLFQDVTRVAWNNPTRYSGDLDGPSVEIHASFAGKQLRFRFYSVPPLNEPISHAVDMSTGEVVRIVPAGT